MLPIAPRRRRFLPAVLWAAGLALSSAPAFAQDEAVVQAERSRDDDRGVRLPNGKLQRDEILKIERRQNLEDARRLEELAGQLRQEIERNESYVLSLSALKKTDEIEKLAKKIRARMRHN
jgi:hypothetical protein